MTMSFADVRSGGTTDPIKVVWDAMTMWLGYWLIHCRPRRRRPRPRPRCCMLSNVQCTLVGVGRLALPTGPRPPRSIRLKQAPFHYSVFEQIVENFHGLSFCYSYSPPDIPDPKMLLETNSWS